jgi:aspartyl-tRNA synthetase
MIVTEAQTSDVTELDGKLNRLRRELQTQRQLPPSSTLADHRVLALRVLTNAPAVCILFCISSRELVQTPANHALFKINSSVCQLFREFLLDRCFTEIHSPRLRAVQPGAGYPEFKLRYFDRTFA